MATEAPHRPTSAERGRRERLLRLGWLWRELGQRRGEVSVALGVTIVSPVVALLLPVRVQSRTEELLAGTNVAELASELAFLLAIVFASLTLTALRRFLMARLCLGIVTGLRQTLYRHIMAIAPRELQKTEGGQVTNAFTYDLEVLHKALARMLGELFPSLFLGVIYGAALFWFSWRLALILILVFVPLALLTNYFASLIHRTTHAAQARQGELLGELAETLAGPKEIKLFRLEGKLIDRFRDVNQMAFRLALRRELFSEMHPFAVSLIVAVAIAGVILLSAVFLGRGWIDAGSLGGFVVCLGLFYPQVQEAGHALGHAVQIFAGRERIDRVLALEVERETAEKDGPVPANGAIELDHVTFAYPGAKPAIEDLSLRIADGERVAIVGPSGAGKSTLLEILPRFNEISSGEITIGGVPLGDIPLAALRSRIGLVLQVPFLFRGTLRENLAAGQTGLSDERIAEVAAQARVDEFVRRLPDDYDTLIEPGGANLSVGQRQRVAIARVLLRDPPILLLDEPTSALDADSETHVADAIRAAAAGRTTIIVAHRLSTVRDVDRIIVMDRGRVVEEGNHVELLLRGGLYAELHAQFAGEQGRVAGL